MYVNEYASGTQQQYYTTNESYSATGNHQGETYIVPVDDALLASQSRESPQAISAVSREIQYSNSIPLFQIRKFSAKNSA